MTAINDLLRRVRPGDRLQWRATRHTEANSPDATVSEVTADPDQVTIEAHGPRTGVYRLHATPDETVSTRVDTEGEEHDWGTVETVRLVAEGGETDA